MRLKTIAKRFLLLIVGLMATIGFLSTTLLYVNRHLRFQTQEIVAHYNAKLFSPPSVVICGDSLAAGGGHWSALLGEMPFRTRNLSGNGYLFFQIASQIQNAKSTYPVNTIVIFGGTNDAFSLYKQRLTEEDVATDLRQLVEAIGESSAIVVVPPLPRNDAVWPAMRIVRRIMLEAVMPENIIIVDSGRLLADGDGVLMPEFSTDGVHYSTRAYRVLGSAIQEALVGSVADGTVAGNLN